MKTLEDISKELDAKISRDVISKRDAGNGRKLDYLEAWYVIDRMNQIFGHLNWSRETLEMRLLPGDRPAYMAKVKVTVELPNVTELGKYHSCSKEGHGFGNAKGKDGTASSQDHELAIKEAESDAFKRAAMQFGLSMGLALYDKTQEHVEEIGEVSRAKVPPLAVKEAASPPAKLVKPTKDLIKEGFRILKAVNKIQAQEFVDRFLKPLAVEKVDLLTEEKEVKCLEMLREAFPELK